MKGEVGFNEGCTPVMFINGGIFQDSFFGVPCSIDFLPGIIIGHHGCAIGNARFQDKAEF